MSQDQLRAVFAACLVAYTASVIFSSLRVSKAMAKLYDARIDIETAVAATATEEARNNELPKE